jgi:hypothetical protein
MALAGSVPAAQQAIELAPEPAVPTYKSIDAGRGDPQPARSRQRLGDLLGAPPFLEQGDNQLPVGDGVPPLPMAQVPAILALPLSDLVAVGTVVCTAVRANLP